MNKQVIVLVTDNNYLHNLFETVVRIRTIGNYIGDIVVLPHPNLKECDPLLKHSQTYNYELKFFDLIDLSHILEKIKERPFNDTDGREYIKTFQWHKMYLFHTYFKKWDTLFYLDIAMNIYKDINIFFSFVEPNKITAHCDDYPDYKRNLSNQFNHTSYPELSNDLDRLINLNRYSFQTGILLFKTDSINENTFSILMKLANKYHISRTNEQGIMNIYFNGIYKMWKELPVYHNNTYTYDYWNRDDHRVDEYIMLKRTRQ